MGGGEDLGAGAWAIGAGGNQYAYTSFPVDVIVFFHMQPSTFRFSCLPASRVECMLQLPSLDIVFSSKRAETDKSGYDIFLTYLGFYFNYKNWYPILYFLYYLLFYYVLVKCYQQTEV